MRKKSSQYKSRRQKKGARLELSKQQMADACQLPLRRGPFPAPVASVCLTRKLPLVNTRFRCMVGLGFALDLTLSFESQASEKVGWLQDPIQSLNPRLLLPAS